MCSIDLLLNVLGKQSNNTGRRKDSFRSLDWVLISHKLPGKRIRLDISRTTTIKQSKVKPKKKQRSSGLARIQSLGSTDMLQFLVTSPNQEWKLGPFKTVRPLLQGLLYREQLTVPEIIIPLHQQ